MLQFTDNILVLFAHGRRQEESTYGAGLLGVALRLVWEWASMSMMALRSRTGGVQTRLEERWGWGGISITISSIPIA